MTERETISVDFRTGEVRETRTVTPAGQTLEQRIGGLQAQAAEQLAGESIARTVAVRCDGCGQLAELSEPRLPDGWTSDERGERCPGCQ
jgi:hypothetical protein